MQDFVHQQYNPNQLAHVSCFRYEAGLTRDTRTAGLRVLNCSEDGAWDLKPFCLADCMAQVKSVHALNQIPKPAKPV